jgi:hypothetical protein
MFDVVALQNKIANLRLGAVVDVSSVPNYLDAVIYATEPQGRRLIMSVTSRDCGSTNSINAAIHVPGEPSSNIHLYNDQLEIWSYSNATGTVRGEPARKKLDEHLDLLSRSIPDRDAARSVVALQKIDGKTSRLLIED